MPQRRFVIAMFHEYNQAQEAREIFLKEDESIRYQIRRKRNGFALVKRVPTSEAQSSERGTNPTTKSRKHPKKYRYFTGEPNG